MILVKIMIVLVVVSITLCIIVFVYLFKNGEGLEGALSFTVVLLVASIPLAMEIVTTTTLALGSKELSHHGAIVSRLAAIEDMAGMAILCSDKTGTLTLNKMMIQEETPIYVEGETQYTLLRYAAMAAKWKEPPKDALDTLTLNAVDMASMDKVEQLEYMPFDPVVKRTEGTVRDKETGKVYKTTKGAPHVLLKLVNDPETAHLVEKDVYALGIRGIRSLAVAKTDDSGRWRMLGMLTFLDPPRPDTKQVNSRSSVFVRCAHESICCVDYLRRSSVRCGCEDDHWRPLTNCQGDSASAGPGSVHQFCRGTASVGPGDKAEAKELSPGLRGRLSRRRRLRAGLPGAQVLDRGVLA